MPLPAAIRHHAKRHAAVRTCEYLYSQLIPYIGNKRRLLPLIARGLARTGVRNGTFVDLFSGSSVVSRLAKTLGHRVIANDWEPYAAALAHASVALNRAPRFSRLGGVERVFETLNALPPRRGYVARHLCPRDDENPDPARERMFFTRSNGERIDAARHRIAEWDADAMLDVDERAYLLSALLYAVCYVSNTSGVFKGFHRGWGGRTGTALYRILSTLTLRPPALFDNGRENLATRLDAHELASDLRAVAGGAPDVAYLDPPYNQHPYGSNYHVLNTVALGDEPPFPEAIPEACDAAPRCKSAIRTDWRTLRRSPYNSARDALPALRRLVGALDARWIVMSYSTDGNVPVRAVLTTLSERGALTVLAQPYKRYRVSTPRMSPRPRNVEFLALVDTGAPVSVSRVDAIAERIKRLELRASKAER